MESSVPTASPVVPVVPRRLSPREKLALTREILGSYVRARRMLARHGLRGALDRLRGDRAHAPDAALDPVAYGEALRLGSVVARVGRPLPIDSRCLMQSLVLTSLLARRKMDVSLVIGVHGGESFGAHAWVELAGRPLLPSGGADFERLVEL